MNMMNTKICAMIGAASLVGLLVAGSASAAVMIQETFSGDPGTVAGRDGQFSTAAYNGGIGNTTANLGGGAPSGAGSFEGSFAAQGSPSPQTDALRITDPAFLANYSTTYPLYNNFTWTFAFWADDVLPSDFVISFGNLTDTFYYNAIGQLTSPGQWNTVTVPLTSGSWIGGPGTYTSYDLSSMTFIDIQYSRNGTGAQQYYFDDFTLNGTLIPDGGGGGGSAVPEPNTLFTMVLGMVGMFILRKQLTHYQVFSAA